MQFDIRSHPRILVAEDDPFAMELIAEGLRQAGCMVIKCTDGVEALVQAAKAPPTAIILDLHMPKMDGFAFLESKATNPELKDIPTLVLTASRNADIVRRAVALGAVDYLAKPFSSIELVHRVHRLLRRTHVAA